MNERTKDLDDTIQRTQDAEQEMEASVKNAEEGEERLEEAEDHIVTEVLGQTRDHHKEPSGAIKPEGLVD